MSRRVAIAVGLAVVGAARTKRGKDAVRVVRRRLRRSRPFVITVNNCHFEGWVEGCGPAIYVDSEGVAINGAVFSSSRPVVMAS